MAKAITAHRLARRTPAYPAALQNTLEDRMRVPQTLSTLPVKAFEVASPHRFRPTYAGANVGHPSNSSGLITNRSIPRSDPGSSITPQTFPLPLSDPHSSVSQESLSELDGCPMFASAYMGRKRWGEAPSNAFTERKSPTLNRHTSLLPGLVKVVAGPAPILGPPH